MLLSPVDLKEASTVSEEAAGEDDPAPAAQVGQAGQVVQENDVPLAKVSKAGRWWV